MDDAVIMAAGRPVLLLPNDGSVSALARRVLSAWSGTREAGRAVVDAPPLLQQAQDVRIISLGPDKPDASPDEADLATCTALVRHHIKCKATERIAAHADVDRSLTEQAIG